MKKTQMDFKEWIIMDFKEFDFKKKTIIDFKKIVFKKKNSNGLWGNGIKGNRF